MKILNINKTKAQLSDFENRVECRVEYDNGDAELLWIEVAGPHAESVSDAADPWVVMLLPLAVSLGVPIETEGAVDVRLLGNLQSLQRVWSSWYPRLSPIEIQSQAVNRFPSWTELRRPAACFFSGGVDSFHILSTCTGPNRVSQVAGLITVWGFDIPIDNPDQFAVVRATCEDVAEEVGLEANIVATNIRTTQFNSVDWGFASHGCALSSIGLLFAEAYGKVLIGSTHRIPDFQPWGSTVITDPLCSSSVLEIVHYGATESRVDKTRALVDCTPAREHLRVCWRKKAAGNCSKCTKCIRTMSTLDMYGKLEDFKTFDASSFSLDMLANMDIRSVNDEAFIDEIAQEAAVLGNSSTYAAAKSALDRFRRGQRIRSVFRPLKRGLKALIARCCAHKESDKFRPA